MVKGASAHSAERDTGVPHQSLRRNFEKCLGFSHSKFIKICPLRWPAMEETISRYEIPAWGGGKGRLLLPDEEQLIVATCELAAKMCFPWSPTEVTRLAWSMMKKVDPGCPCPGRGWLRGFEARWKTRLHKCKTSSIDPARARQANERVMNECFDKYVEFHNDLIARGEITAEQLTHFEDFKINVDEIGGDELGKRAKCYQSTKQHSDTDPKWRNIEVGGDHNPFHASSMFGTIANGTICPFWTLIHSAVSKSKRVRADLLEGVPGSFVQKFYMFLCWQVVLPFNRRITDTFVIMYVCFNFFFINQKQNIFWPYLLQKHGKF